MEIQKHQSHQQEQQIFYQNSSPNNQYFDSIVNVIQQIVLSQQFDQYHHSFINQYSHTFTQQQENKIQYLQIFNQYQNTIEKHLIQKINQKIDNFDICIFLKQLDVKIKANQRVMQQQLQEILMSFVDFQIFKNVMLQNKKNNDYMMQHTSQNTLNRLVLKGQSLSLSICGNSNKNDKKKQ